MANDYLFAEILDAAGNRMPIAEGTVGELVCTHIDKECQPLVRFRKRDVITGTGTGPFGCGRTAWRFRVAGRTDDMFNVRGINVLPGAVQQAIEGRPDLSAGHFRIILSGPAPHDRIAIPAEAADGLPPGRWAEAAAALTNQVREQVGATATVEMIPFDTLDGGGGAVVRGDVLP